MQKRILIFGGDGFCGWPTALRLSNEGHEISIIDNLCRRNADIELGCNSLTPIRPIEKRLKSWKKLTGKDIEFYNLNASSQYIEVFNVISKIKPDVIVHFAEQRAAPYSMKSGAHKRYTVENNTKVTHNILCAIVESNLDIHLVHLGTMGVYGYGTTGMTIPEGYLNVKYESENKLHDAEILYPANPGSIYHLTKTMDALQFYFYNKNDNLRITDLHQGIVWGTQTTETKQNEDLINRFDYDGDYGTVLNRFLMQSAIGHPLTVHGTGGQTRAFIHISDTVKCISLAINNPPTSCDKVKIFNQATETHTIKILAEKISKLTGTKIQYLKNPRIESAENELKVDNENFLKLGLNPTTLDEGLMSEIIDISKKYKHNCDRTKIISTSTWSKNI